MLLNNHVEKSVSDLPTDIVVLWIDEKLVKSKIG